MKKKLLFSALFSLLFVATAFSQEVNKVIKDPMMGMNVMAGPCNLDGLQHGLFGPWFNYQYKSYKPESKVVSDIQKKLDKTQLTVVFGSWCGDSKEQVGRFYKILNDAGYNTASVKAIAVDRALKVPGSDISKLDIKRVPTFIVSYQGKEIGRIVESPKKTLEKDLQNILQKVD
ncbi:MAG: thioredoxin family protein [Bacteroidales bacterium]|nr:thioredoxin family protein [Bacteroidales bacterium]